MPEEVIKIRLMESGSFYRRFIESANFSIQFNKACVLSLRSVDDDVQRSLL